MTVTVRRGSGMTVAELRAKLTNVPDDLIVLIDGAFDHGYQPTTGAMVETVEEYKDRSSRVYKEYWDDQGISEGAEARQVFVVSVQ